MYSRLSNLVLGFHGCDQTIGKKILHSNGTLHLEKSSNDYDWLGNGIYFWENNPERALKFAQDAVTNKHLTLGSIKEPFVIGAVIEALHSLKKKQKVRQFDSVRGVFVEGKELYPLAGFREKNHIQLCIRNSNCIKGYFHLQDNSSDYPYPS